MAPILNNSTAARRHRHINVLQFGEGNFLRAFVDWIFDIANAEGCVDLGVAVVKPRAGKSAIIETLTEQNYLYHVCLEGVADGEPKCESRLVSVIEDAFVPQDSEKYNHYILSPSLRFVVSNTTEAGIVYADDDVRADLPATFPGKVTNLLWRRWKHFGGDAEKGLIFLPCELIEDNGDKLREYVLRHAAEAALPTEFIKWVDQACIFTNTLVDRIVSGAVTDEKYITDTTGYADKCVVKGELYHLWVIGGKDIGRVRRELPLDRAGLHVEFVDSAASFRERKVRVLNGSHTGMVAMGLLAGCETVLDAFTNPNINRFVNDMVSREVLPLIAGDEQELRTFADGILERFLNPYLHHRLESISLNSLSKWEARNLGTAKDYYKANGKVADYQAFNFACLLALYAPGSDFTPQDDAAHIDYIHTHWNDKDIEGTVAAILGADIFIENFEAAMPGFTSKVTEYVSEIRNEGISTALTHFLQSHQ